MLNISRLLFNRGRIVFIIQTNLSLALFYLQHEMLTLMTAFKLTMYDKVTQYL